MSSKDDFIFEKRNLLKTSSGKNILKKGILKDKGYTQFKRYVDLSKKEYDDFALRYENDVFTLIKSDPDPITTHKEFIKEIGGSKDLQLSPDSLIAIRNKLLGNNNLSDRIKRILNSNFVKMTFPVFYALFDGYMNFKNDKDLLRIRNSVVDGHLIAIDLSEPMDRIIYKDEDIEYLEKNYDKYRAILGTAGKNVSLNQKPLSEIYYIGMAKASECVGCGNEIQDAIITKGIKSPSWPLFYSITTGDVKRGFKLTIEKSYSYLSEAYLALNMLDDDFEIKPFLSFLFLTVSHYNEFWYRELLSNHIDLLKKFQKDIDSSSFKYKVDS